MSVPDGFIRVTHRRRCPICQRPDWCLLSIDGTRVVCARTISSKPFGDGGYIHQLTNPVAMPVRRPLRKPAPRDHAGKRIDWNTMARKFEEALEFEAKEYAAQQLGVSSGSLDRLAIGWCQEREALSFPMFDSPGHCVGIRLRRHDGSKFAVSGSTNALFVPRKLHSDGFLLIVEGPTDTAAALDLGFDAIGRPSCNAAVDMTVSMVEKLGHKEVVIVTDYDEPKRRPAGGVFRPGQEGAEKLADALVTKTNRNVRVVNPLKGKDIRQWKAAGATNAAVRAVIRNTALWPRPTPLSRPAAAR